MNRLRPVVAIALGLIATSTFAADDAAQPLTFTRDIAPIIFNQCSGCHRPGEAAPFSLLTYADVRKRARLIAAVTESRYMPPWKPEPGYGEFIGARGLSDEQIAALGRWARGDRAEGDPADLPPRPQWTEGWQLGEPDIKLTLAEPYMLGPEGDDVYRYFVIPIPVDETTYVKAWEFRPGNAPAVHHAGLRIDRTATSRNRDAQDAEPGFAGVPMNETLGFDGLANGWVVGATPFAGHEGIAATITPGTDLVLEVHMPRTGKPEAVQPSVGPYLADGPPTRHPILVRVGPYIIDIPPGKSDYKLSDTYVLPVDVHALAVMPHAHYLATEMKGWAVLPDGTTNWLVRIREWDFNWQGTYQYREPVFLPRGTTLAMEYTYDNSSDNVRNPNDPPKRVVYGPNSTDEMCGLWLQLLPDSRADQLTLRAHAGRENVASQLAAAKYRVRADPNDFWAHFNLGVMLHRKDLPQAMEHYRQALKANPDYAQAYNNLGNALMSLGRAEEAIVHYRDALSRDADFVEVYNNIGCALGSLGRLDEAVDNFHQALRRNPDYRDAQENLRLALRQRQLKTQPVETERE